MKKMRERWTSSVSLQLGTRLSLAALFLAVLVATATLLVTSATGTAWGDASCEQYECAPSGQEQEAGPASTGEGTVPPDQTSPSAQQYEPAATPSSSEAAPPTGEQYAPPSAPVSETAPKEPAPLQDDPVAEPAQYGQPSAGGKTAPTEESSPQAEQPSQGVEPEADSPAIPDPTVPEEPAVPVAPTDGASQPTEGSGPEGSTPSADSIAQKAPAPQEGTEQPPETATEGPSAAGQADSSKPVPASFEPVEGCTVSNCGSLGDPDGEFYYGDCALYETASGTRVVGCQTDYYEGKCAPTSFYPPGAGTHDWGTELSPYATVDACPGDAVWPPEPPTDWYYEDYFPGDEEPMLWDKFYCYDAEGGWDPHCGLDVPERYECTVYGGTVEGTVRGCVTGSDYKSGNGWCWPVSTYDMDKGEKLGRYTECIYKYKREVCGKGQCGTKPPAPENWACSRINYQFGSLYAGREEIICVNPALSEMNAGNIPYDRSKTCVMYYDERGNFVDTAPCGPGGDDMGIGSWAADGADRADDTLGRGGGSGKDSAVPDGWNREGTKTGSQAADDADHADGTLERGEESAASSSEGDAAPSRDGDSSEAPHGSGPYRSMSVVIPYALLEAGPPVVPPERRVGPSLAKSLPGTPAPKLGRGEGVLYTSGRAEASTPPDVAASSQESGGVRTANESPTARYLEASAPSPKRTITSAQATPDASEGARDAAAGSTSGVSLGGLVPVLLVAALGSVVIGRRRLGGGGGRAAGADPPRVPAAGAVGLLGSTVAVISGALIGLSTIAFIALLVFGYYLVTPSEFENVATARAIASGWLPETWLLLWTFFAALALTYRGVPHAVLTGLLVGLAAALAEQMTVLLEFPPVLPTEAATYGLLGGAGGLLGGMMGAHEHGRVEAGERALFEATVGIARAVNADGVAAELGSMIGEERVVGVGLWRDAFYAGGGELSTPSAVWSSGRSGVEFPAARLAEAVIRVRGKDKSGLVLPETLPAAERLAWAEYGVGSAFVAPLLSARGGSLGLLFVGFRGRRWLVGRGKRRLISAAAAAGLALEKLAAVEEDRKKEKRLGVLEERERVSRELHDSIIQYLGVIAGEIDSAEIATEVGREERVWFHVNRAREGARRASGEARRLLEALRSQDLEEGTLADALAKATGRFHEEAGIETTFEVSGEPRPLGPEKEHALLRITQEALTNVRKHSGASSLAVSLLFGEERVRIEVVDDGLGLGEGGGSSDGGFGMHSMRERAEGFGGWLVVDGTVNAGTRVVVEAPS